MNRYVQRGSTDQSAWVQLLNADGDYVTGLTYSDVTITVRRFLGGRLVSELSLTPTELTAIDDPHADGGFVEDSSRKRYRVDLQDAAVATGLDSADNVELKVEATGVVGNTSEEIVLVDYNWATPADLQITVAPLSASITARVNGTTITYFVGEIISQTVAITDSAGSAVDLSGKTLQVVIDSPKASHGDVQVIGSGSITVSGASNNQITFTNTAAVTATARTLRWALRDTANGDEVLAHGRVVVTEAAEED